MKDKSQSSYGAVLKRALRPLPMLGALALAGIPIAVLHTTPSAFAQQQDATEALFRAVATNDFEAAKRALSQGADLLAVNASGLEPADIAIDNGFFDLAHFLLASRDNALAAARDNALRNHVTLGEQNTGQDSWAPKLAAPGTEVPLLPPTDAAPPPAPTQQPFGTDTLALANLDTLPIIGEIAEPQPQQESAQEQVQALAQELAEVATQADPAPQTPVTSIAPTPAPKPEPIVKPQPQPVAKPVQLAEATPPSPIAAPDPVIVAEPVVEPVVEPAVEPAVESAAEPATNSALESIAETVADEPLVTGPDVQPVIETVIAEPVVEPVLESVVEPAIETIETPTVMAQAAPAPEMPASLASETPTAALETKPGFSQQAASAVKRLVSRFRETVSNWWHTEPSETESDKQLASRVSKPLTTTPAIDTKVYDEIANKEHLTEEDLARALGATEETPREATPRTNDGRITLSELQQALASLPQRAPIDSATVNREADTAEQPQAETDIQPTSEPAPQTVAEPEPAPEPELVSTPQSPPESTSETMPEPEPELAQALEAMPEATMPDAGADDLLTEFLATPETDTPVMAEPTETIASADDALELPNLDEIGGPLPEPLPERMAEPVAESNDMMAIMDNLPTSDEAPAPDAVPIGEVETAMAAPMDGWDVKSVDTTPRAPNSADSPLAPPTAGNGMLSGVIFTVGENLTFGHEVAADKLEAMNQDSVRKPCVAKKRGTVLFCVNDVEWPAEVKDYFYVDSVMYAGQRAVVRYDDGRASNFHVLFNSEFYDDVLMFLSERFGPPTQQSVRTIAPFGQARQDNPTAIWQNSETGTTRIDTLEIRKFDDSHGSFPDTKRGALMLSSNWSEKIFPQLSTLDLMILKQSTLTPQAATPESVW